MELDREQPYCEAQVGGMECGRPVERWAHQCEKHDPEGAVRRAATMSIQPDKVLAEAQRLEDFQHELIMKGLRQIDGSIRPWDDPNDPKPAIYGPEGPPIPTAEFMDWVSRSGHRRWIYMGFDRGAHDDKDN